jgi:PAS domain S-box-containing protein
LNNVRKLRANLTEKEALNRIVVHFQSLGCGAGMNRSIHLLDLISKEKLDGILRVFTEVTGVASTIADVEGQPITELHNFTAFCLDYCRSTDEGRRRCHESDRFGGRKAVRQKKPFIYNCLNAGLIDCAAPVIVAGHHLASMFCGQVLEKPLEAKEAVQQARAIGTRDVEGCLKELEKIPLMSRGRLLSIVNLMEVIIQTVSELALQKYLLHKHSEHYLNRLINSVSDCIVSTDADGTVSMINEAGTKIFGYEMEEVIGQSIQIFLSDAASRKDCRKRLASGLNHNWHAELAAIKADGRIFPVQISLSGITDENGKNVGNVGVIRDISEEKKVERMKEDLIGMVTHDMRNPVLSLQKALQLMVDGSLGSITPTQMEVMHLALATSHQLFGMTNDLLDIYRSESGQFLLYQSVVDMRQIIQESISQLKFFAKDRRVSILFDPSPPPLKLRGDQNRLMRTCVNLLDNAIRFSPEGGTIRIASIQVNGNYGQAVGAAIPYPSSQRIQAGQPHILTEVSDRGPGIPLKYQQAIFDKFFTIKSKDRNGRKGVGLGLAFCKQAIEAHGGFIWVKSPLASEEPDRHQGCRFYFILPADPVA